MRRRPAGWWPAACPCPCCPRIRRTGQPRPALGTRVGASAARRCTSTSRTPTRASRSRPLALAPGGGLCCSPAGRAGRTWAASASCSTWRRRPPPNGGRLAGDLRRQARRSTPWPPSSAGTAAPSRRPPRSPAGDPRPPGGPVASAPGRVSTRWPSGWSRRRPGTTSCCPKTRLRLLRQIADQVAHRGHGLRHVGLRRADHPRARGQRAVRRAERDRQDHGRRGARRPPAARPVPHRPVRGGEQVHRRDGEEPAPAVRRGGERRRASCSSTRPTRCSASAAR